MHKDILEELCCPSCKGKLFVEPFSDEVEDANQNRIPENKDKNWNYETIIEYGILLCSACKKWFPIYSYVPVMLLFKTTFHEKFAKRFAERLGKFSDYTMPNAKPKSGELSVQETFTDEWNIKDIQDSELSFTYTRDDLVNLNREVWLKWINHSLESIKDVLNVGCGIGMETLALKEVVRDAKIYAIDLNFALLKSGRSFKSNSNIHPIISSLFDIPFREASFDLVYSQGVIHHTFSTYKALESISAYVRRCKYLFIWIYGLDDHLVLKGFIGFIARIVFVLEKIFRPLVSRLPKGLRDIFFNTISIIAHPLVKMRVRHKDKWTIKETNHGLRDLFSPKYAHRSSYNEVIEWFENLGFKIVDIQSPAAYRKLFKKRIHGIGLTGQKL